MRVRVRTAHEITCFPERGGGWEKVKPHPYVADLGHLGPEIKTSRFALGQVGCCSGIANNVQDTL